jgi:hypothetical protein
MEACPTPQSPHRPLATAIRSMQRPVAGNAPRNTGLHGIVGNEECASCGFQGRCKGPNSARIKSIGSGNRQNQRATPELRIDASHC